MVGCEFEAKLTQSGTLHENCLSHCDEQYSVSPSPTNCWFSCVYATGLWTVTACVENTLKQISSGVGRSRTGPLPLFTHIPIRRCAAQSHEKCGAWKRLVIYDRAKRPFLGDSYGVLPKSSVTGNMSSAVLAGCGYNCCSFYAIPCYSYLHLHTQLETDCEVL